MLKIKYHIVIGMCGIFALLDNRAESKPLSDKDIYYANMIQPRGPDHSEFYQMGKAHFVFHRLAINGLDDSSSMPFVLNNCLLIANAEIYNHKELEELYNIKPTSESDCEILIHLYNKFGRGQGAIHRICSEIDAEFAFIIYDDNSKTMFAARDSYGVRPLFYSNDDKYYFASEMKAIPSDVNIKAVLPGSIIEIYKDNMTISYYHFVRITKWLDISISQIHQTIRKYFYGAVKRRLMSQRQIGCLLSGGLDSSLVAAVIAREVPDLHCFSIGIGEESVDLIAARRVAEFIGIKPSNHHIIHFTVEDGFHALKYVIFALESWDVTTIRAGIVNYLLAKYIAKNTDIKVLLSGSGADEVFCGYQYSKMINSSADLARDSRRLLSELYMFDNLRDDRVTAAFGLEVRVPFL
jgi:asparagine synthase (glutamine-hydrolysing)